MTPTANDSGKQALRTLLLGFHGLYGPLQMKEIVIEEADKIIEEAWQKRMDVKTSVFTIEVTKEGPKRWLGELLEIDEVACYGESLQDAVNQVFDLAHVVMEERGLPHDRLSTKFTVIAKE